MNSKSQRVMSAIALVLSFAIAQVYIGVSFAQAGATTGPNESSTSSITSTASQQMTGVLSVQGGRAITVNGASAITGSTILSGASIETPAGVGGTVNLTELGSLEIEPGSKLTLEFQDGNIKVTLLQGCVTLHANKGVTGEIDKPDGNFMKTDPRAEGVLRACNPETGAVLTAPASAEGGGGLFGSGTFADVAILAGFGTIVSTPFIFGNRNPSRVTP